MGNGISKANLNDMTVAAQFFDAAITDCNTTKAKLEQNLGALNWGGGSATVYHTAMNNWTAKFNIVVTNLQTVMNTMQGNKVNMIKNEDFNTELGNSINKLLAG